MTPPNPVVSYRFTDNSLAPAFGTGPTLSLTGTASINASGLLCNANNEGAEATTPAGLKIDFDAGVVSFLLAGSFSAAPTSAGELFGASYEAAGGAPYYGYAFRHDGDTIRLAANFNGDFQNLPVIQQITGAGAFVLIGVLKSGMQKGWYNGSLNASDTINITVAPVYQSDSLLFVGEASFHTTTNSNALFTHAAIWDVELSDTDVSDLTADPDLIVPSSQSPYLLKGMLIG